MTLADLTAPLLIGSGAFASWSDLQFRRLPNPFCLALAVLGLLLAAVGQGSEALVSHLAHAGIALIGGIALFAFGAIGGGDAKYYAGVAAWFPIDSGARLLGAVSLAGLVLVAFWYAQNLLRERKASTVEQGDFAKLPFGIAIALGAIAAAWSAR